MIDDLMSQNFISFIMCCWVLILITKHISLCSHPGGQVDDMITAMLKTGGQEEVSCAAGEHTTSGSDRRFDSSGGKSERSGVRPKKSPVFLLLWGHSHLCVRDQFRWLSVVSNYLIFGGRILHCSSDWTQTHDSSASTSLELRLHVTPGLALILYLYPAHSK